MMMMMMMMMMMIGREYRHNSDDTARHGSPHLQQHGADVDAVFLDRNRTPHRSDAWGSTVRLLQRHADAVRQSRDVCHRFSAGADLDARSRIPRYARAGCRL